MAAFEITADLNLKKIVAEVKEFAKAMNEFANDLEQIEKKYTDGIHKETVTEFADRCRECGKMKRCKDCKYFREADVDGMPLIENRDFCLKWGGKCKTNKDGYCFLFEPEEGNDSDERKTESEE